MDKQYTNTIVVDHENGTYYLDPNVALDTPNGFQEYFAHAEENIFMVANRFYQDTSYWYLLAMFSGIVDPFNIPEGTKILLPIYDDKSPSDIFA